MNQDWQEKRIRQLFHELGREDAGRAPSFARVLQAALLRRGKPRRRLRLWRLAAVAAMPVVAVVVALLLLTSYSRKLDSTVDFTSLQTIPLPAIPLPGPYRETAPEITPPITLGRFPRATKKQSLRRSPASRTNNSSILISEWQSPTDCLLRVPGNDLLKSLPRVPDSSPAFRRSLIETHN